MSFSAGPWIFDHGTIYADDHAIAHDVDGGANGVLMAAAPDLFEAVTTVLSKSPGRWISRGYGQFSCSSCGAERHVDYGDHEQPTTERRESCSFSCPWARLEAAIAKASVAESP